MSGKSEKYHFLYICLLSRAQLSIALPERIYMEYSFTAVLAGIIAVVFAVLGLAFGGMLAFNVTAAKFSRLEFKSVLSLVFLGLIALMVVAIVADSVIS